MTTTSETAYLPPASSGPPEPATTPRSAQLGTPSCQSLSPIKRHLSPAKSRSTPSRSAARSPRKSPAKNFQSVKSVSFTPQRIRQPPRAWERRPATPFVPRDEKQKIWKRVPLSELGVDTNRPVGISRREHEAGKDYARVVKRLKVVHHNTGDADEDKENSACAVDTKVQSEDGDLKRRERDTGSGHKYVSMRMEEDQIWGSPKKKLRQLLIEQNAGGDDSEEEQDCNFEAEPEEAANDNHRVEDHKHEYRTRSGHEVEGMLHAAEDDSQEDISEPGPKRQAAGPHGECQRETVKQREVTQQEPVDSTTFTAMVLKGSEVTAATLSPDTVVDETEASDIGSFDAETGEVLQEDGRPPQNAFLGHPVAGGSIEDELQLSASSAETEFTEQEQIVNNAPESGVLSSEELTAVGEEQSSNDDIGSSSPPTILAENVTIDELAARDSPTTARTKPVAEAGRCDHSEEQETTDICTTREALPRRTSDDETAFLRAFMSRTKATKAERAAQGQTLQHITEDEMTKPNAEQERTRTGSHDDLAQAPALEPPELTVQNDIAPASPLRRSRRAAVTSIPRPQGLPNSIQLKRANGTEFIFKANQASSTANVAMATRSNTKKNRGTAVDVPARLEQLLDEKAVEGAGAEQPTEATTEKTSVEIFSDKAIKKRKREKNDIGAKAKKVLRWNEENLVSYQEAEKNPDWENMEDSSQESIRDQEYEQPDKQVKLTLALASGSSENISPKEDIITNEKDVKQVQQKEQKVRRVRRGVAGSVNGTPAPKTRSMKTIYPDEIDVPAGEGAAEASVTVAAATEQLADDEASKATATAATTMRKSRMPVSASSRREGAASASTTRANSSLPNKATGAAVSKDQTKGGSKAKTASGKQKDDQNGDLLGKRRLRVRS